VRPLRDVDAAKDLGVLSIDSSSGSKKRVEMQRISTRSIAHEPILAGLLRILIRR
jgi:hypothetical protein